MSDVAALVRLLQLASPSLPVGAYSYSQGLEAAIDAGVVHDAPSARAWIGDLLALSMATMEAPIAWRLLQAWACGDCDAARAWNELFIASRETTELRAETLQMGHSLRALLRELAPEASGDLDAFDDICFPAAFARAAIAASIAPREALSGYVFAWLESQVLAAVKSVPLGQTQGQRLLRDLGACIPALVAQAGTLPDEALANFAPGLAILSSRHETQYTRLFRS